MITPQEALEHLQAGNKRFIKDCRTRSIAPTQDRRNKLARGQHPIAIVLSCADSRVPPELVFDQGLGDLFVVRVAGHIATEAMVESIEFAADRFASPLVVVLGHTDCGAVKATLEAIRQESSDPPIYLRSIIKAIEPSIAPLLRVAEPAALARKALRAHIGACTNQLREHSEILKQLMEQGKLLIVGAEYETETGQVNFFDQP